MKWKTSILALLAIGLMAPSFPGAPPPGGGGGGSPDGLGTTGPKGLFTTTGPNTAAPNPVFSFGNLGAAPAINWANGQTQAATINQASATFVPFTGGVSGGNYTLILTQDSTPGTLIWPASVRWPAGMGPAINMDPNSVTLVNCWYDGTNYNCIGGVSSASFTQGTGDPTTGNPACSTGDFRENTDTGAMFYCEDGPTDTWRMIGEYTAITDFVTTMKFTARDVDDAPGFSDAAGADPNPPPWSRVGKWFFGIFHNPDTYSIESILSWSWNTGGGEATNPFLPQWGFSMEPAFGAGMRSGKEQQEAYFQWSVPQYQVTIASGGSNAIALGMNLTFTGGEVCRPLDTDADLSNGAVLTMVCSNAAGTARDAPDNTDVITACTGPSSPAACSPMPAGTVSGSAFDQNIAVRPMFLECLPQYPGCGWKMQRGIEKSTGVAMYYVLASPGDGTMHLGNGDVDDVNITQVFIPAHPSASLGSDNTPIVVQKKGGVGVDSSNSDAGAHNDTSALGGQLVVGDGSFSWFLLGPTRTVCGAFTSSVSTASNILISALNFREPVEITGLACRDNATSTTLAQITLKRASGAAIGNGIDFVGGAVPCGGNADDLVYVLADTADADRELVSGASLRIDGTGLNFPVSHSVCVSYRELAR